MPQKVAADGLRLREFPLREELRRFDQYLGSRCSLQVFAHGLVGRRLLAERGQHIGHQAPGCTARWIQTDDLPERGHRCREVAARAQDDRLLLMHRKPVPASRNQAVEQCNGLGRIALQVARLGQQEYGVRFLG